VPTRRRWRPCRTAPPAGGGPVLAGAVSQHQAWRGASLAMAPGRVAAQSGAGAGRGAPFQRISTRLPGLSPSRAGLTPITSVDNAVGGPESDSWGRQARAGGAAASMAMTPGRPQEDQLERNQGACTPRSSAAPSARKRNHMPAARKGPALHQFPRPNCGGFRGTPAGYRGWLRFQAPLVRSAGMGRLRRSVACCWIAKSQSLAPRQR